MSSRTCRDRLEGTCKEVVRKESCRVVVVESTLFRWRSSNLRDDGPCPKIVARGDVLDDEDC